MGWAGARVWRAAGAASERRRACVRAWAKEEEEERRRMEALTGEPQDTTGVRARVGSEISSPGRMGVGCLGVPLACWLSRRPGGSSEV